MFNRGDLVEVVDDKLAYSFNVGKLFKVDRSVGGDKWRIINIEDRSDTDIVVSSDIQYASLRCQPRLL